MKMSESRESIRACEISRRVEEIMHYLWDPIGIARVPEARDEYNMYSPTVTAMLMHGSKREELAAYLTKTATETMGLSLTQEGKAHDLDIAGLLVQHYAVINAKYGNED